MLYLILKNKTRQQMNLLKNKKAYEGFTFIETLVSLTVITMICVMLVFCYSSAIKGITKSRKQVNSDLELIDFDTSLRKIINSISLPQWKKDYNFTYTSTSLFLEYVNGSSEYIETTINKNFQIKNCFVIFYDNKKPAGLKVYYSYKNKEYICSELFSSIPFGQVKL